MLRDVILYDLTKSCINSSIISKSCLVALGVVSTVFKFKFKR